MKKLFMLLLIISMVACNNETPVKEKASQVKDTTVVDSTHLKK